MNIRTKKCDLTNFFKDPEILAERTLNEIKVKYDEVTFPIDSFKILKDSDVFIFLICMIIIFL